jgi:hypothetical protein
MILILGVPERPRCEREVTDLVISCSVLKFVGAYESVAKSQRVDRDYSCRLVIWQSIQEKVKLISTEKREGRNQESNVGDWNAAWVLRSSLACSRYRRDIDNQVVG